MMEDAPLEHVSANNTAQQQPVQQQQQQQQQQAVWTMYRPSATTQMGHMGNGVKMLSKHYSACEFADLVELIGRMLMQLMDQIPISADKLTRFHSRASPAITVTEYLTRIVRYSSIEKPSLMSVVFYIDLLSRKYPAFSLSSLTVHRFLITAVTVASKGLCDAFCTNTHYAKVGGLGVAELNMLELEFLKKVDWKIVPEPSVLEAYYTSMISQDPRYCQEPSPVDTQAAQETGEAHDMQMQLSDSGRRTRTLTNDENFDTRNTKILRTDSMDMETEPYLANQNG